MTSGDFSHNGFDTILLWYSGLNIDHMKTLSDQLRDSILCVKMNVKQNVKMQEQIYILITIRYKIHFHALFISALFLILHPKIIHIIDCLVLY